MNKLHAVIMSTELLKALYSLHLTTLYKISLGFLRIFLNVPSANSLALEVHLDPVVEKRKKGNMQCQYICLYVKNSCFSFHFLNKSIY